MRVLIVEDNRSALAQIRRYITSENLDLRQALESRGATYKPLSGEDIVTAETRSAALEMLQREEFDLVLLDLSLPDAPGEPRPAENVLHGYSVLKFTRERSPSPEVVVFSSYARSDKAGFQQFEEALLRADISSMPDDILWKEDYQDPDKFQRKLASYLIDLSATDEGTLDRAGIYVPPRGMPGRTRQLLRRIKQIAWSAERGRPLPDVVLIGERGTGKATLAKAFHLLRPKAADDRRLSFEYVEMSPIYRSKGDPIEVLAGVSGGGAWSLGALPRTTFYKRNGRWQRLPGQQVEEKGQPHFFDGVPSIHLYPRSTDEADFDASGTLYLENVLGDDSLFREEIESILSPDLNQRYVTTRGKPPVRLHIGSSLVLGFTQPYTPRVGQMVIEVPPLRKRSSEEKIWFLERLVNHRRRASKVSDSYSTLVPSIVLESTMEKIVQKHLHFRENLDDLQAVANQVLPEEMSVSWRHLRGLWERDLENTLGERRADPDTKVVQQGEA